MSVMTYAPSFLNPPELLLFSGVLAIVMEVVLGEAVTGELVGRGVTGDAVGVGVTGDNVTGADVEIHPQMGSIKTSVNVETQKPAGIMPAQPASCVSPQE